MESTILVIEDDQAFRRRLLKLLKLNGFSAREAATGKAGVSDAFRNPPDLVILDFVLPGLSGEQVCRSLKSQVATAGVPVLILTGEDKQGQEVSCLDMGADDYLTKPVEPERLLAHCRALIRRSAAAPQAAPERKQVGGLVLDYPSKVATLGGREIGHLTPKEFGVLYDLALRSPLPRDRAALYQEVWGMEAPSEGSLKTVEVHVRRIRLKMGWGPEQWLVTVPGRGYCLVPPKD